ncbi:MAG: SGNH/GDSL hydrolase family protein [Nakamurella sp.]
MAIGSSFAAGPGITPHATGRPAKARQSRRNYPHLVARRCGLDLHDVTSSGATVETVLHTSQFGQPPQITAVTARTDLVTVNLGGNDIGYLPSLITACLPNWILKVPVLGHRLRKATAAARASDRLTRTMNTVGQVFRAVQDQAPDARIICVDYLTVLPAAYGGDLPFDEPTHRALTGLANDLNTALAHACSAHGVELVAASTHSLDHHAWSDEPWTTGWTGARPGADPAFHPNADGITAVSDLIATHVTTLGS